MQVLAAHRQIHMEEKHVIGLVHQVVMHLHLAPGVSCVEVLLDYAELLDVAIPVIISATVLTTDMDCIVVSKRVVVIVSGGYDGFGIFEELHVVVHAVEIASSEQQVAPVGNTIVGGATRFEH